MKKAIFLLTFAVLAFTLALFSCDKSTTTVNSAPLAPSGPVVDVHSGSGLTRMLRWSCSDPDGDPLTYDVHLGLGSNPPLVSSSQEAQSYEAQNLKADTTYYWRIVARDPHGHTTSSPPWSFETENAAGLMLSADTLDFDITATNLSFDIMNSGTGTLTWSISDDQTWIAVSPISGSTTEEADQIFVTVDRSGLSPGDYEGMVTVTSDSDTVSVVVLMSLTTSPTLSVSPTFLDFDSTRTNLTFDVLNAGTGILTWSISDNKTWITVNPTSGSTTTETDQITVTVNRSGLSPDNYDGLVTVISDSDTATVSVSMIVAANPTLSVFPEMLDFEGTHTNLTFDITNSGTGTLTWSISDDKTWITVNPTSGNTTTETDQITVTVNRSGLECGDYSGTVTVSSNGGTETVEILMEVTGSPELIVSHPQTLDFGTSQTSMIFSITNGKPDCGTLTWSISDDKTWITVNPTSGSTTTETDQITVTVNRSGLECGDYSGTVTVSSNGGTETVEILMEVTGSPELIVSPQTLDFGTNQTSKPFSITNGKPDCGTLTWSISDNKTWITVNPTSGSTTTETDQATVTVNRSGMSVGTHTGTVTVTSNGGTKTVEILMEISPTPTLSVSPASLDFTCPDQSSKPFNITNTGTGTLTWSISDDQTWIAVSPTSGSTTTETDQVTVTVNCTGMSCGSYSGTVMVPSNGGTDTIEITMEVTGLPELIVSPQTLDFGTSQTNKPFSITNGKPDCGTLTWSISDNKTWITVNPTSGSTTTETDQITVTVNRSGLECGDYSGTVTVSSNGGTETVEILMEVTGSPELIVSPQTLDFGTNQTSKPFSITNGKPDCGTLTWSISDNRTWITVSPTNGSTTTETDQITVTVNRSGMECGDYSGTVTVSSNGGTETVEILMEVTGSPELNVSPPTLGFGTSQTSKTFSITNGKPDCGTLTWTISDNKPWITVNPTSGSTTTETDQVTVTVSRSGLCPNSYSGTVTVSSNGGTASVTVLMEVAPNPISGSFSVYPDCGKAPLTVTAEAFIDGGFPPYSICWDFGDDSSLDCRNPADHTFSSPGSYDVYVYITDQCGQQAVGGPKQINVFGSDIVILGDDLSFSSFNYGDCDAFGDGHLHDEVCESLPIISKRTSVFTKAASIFWMGAYSFAYGELGREFSVRSCDASSQDAYFYFNYKYYGNLACVPGVAGGHASVKLYCKIKDVTTGSVIASKLVLNESISIGFKDISNSNGHTGMTLQLQDGHTYRAYLRLEAESEASAGIGTTNVVDFWNDWNPSTRKGAYIDGISITFLAGAATEGDTASELSPETIILEPVE